MTDDDDKSQGLPKDGWDKARILLQPVGGIMAAMSIALIGFTGSRYLNERQRDDARFRLYSELQSRREQADSDLRKDMFNSIISTFLIKTNNSAYADIELLNLELLVYNFHEALNLKPLFNFLERKFSRLNAGTGPDADYLARLRRIGGEVSGRQARILESVGVSADLSRVDLDQVQTDPLGQALAERELELNGNKRFFDVTVLEVNTNRQELRVRLQIQDATDLRTDSLPVEATFWLGFFDFPMIDNTRLLGDQRCALTLKRFEFDPSDPGRRSAEITLLYFPGTHSSLRDKPDYNEIFNKLITQ